MHASVAQFSVQVVTADYQLEVRLVSYSNPEHRESDGSRCDSSSRCDNVFSFEIDVGNGWVQPQETGTYKNNDNIIFGDTLKGGSVNPLVFTGVQWRDVSVLVQLHTYTIHELPSTSTLSFCSVVSFTVTYSACTCSLLGSTSCYCL